MDTKRDTISFEEFVASVADVFEQAALGEQITIEREGVLFSLRPKRAREKRKSHRLTRDDALWSIVGIAPSGEPGNTVASNKYQHVANAVASHKVPQVQKPASSTPQVAAGTPVDPA